MFVRVYTFGDDRKFAPINMYFGYKYGANQTASIKPLSLHPSVLSGTRKLDYSPYIIVHAPR